jgi:hypothetical protein
MTRDSNPGPIFSIPGFGIETILIPGSRRDCVMTIKSLPRIRHRPQLTQKSGHGLVGNMVLLSVDAKTIKQRSNNATYCMQTALQLYIGLMVRV